MISIIIPLYNKESTIERAVASVIAQNIEGWELIVVDDGSIDKGPAIVRCFSDQRIRVVHQSNAGVSAARNYGVELASSEIVAFLDADDYWDPGHLANLESLVASFPTASMFATAYFFADERGRARKVRVRDDNNGTEQVQMSDYFADAADYDEPIHSSAVAVCRSALRKIGGFPHGVGSGEDLLTWARLACFGTVGYSKRATAYYEKPPFYGVRHLRSIRRPDNPDYVGIELKRLCEDCTHLRPSLLRYLGEWYRIRSMLSMELNERKDCLAELGKAVHTSGPRLRDFVVVGLLLLPYKTRAELIARYRENRLLHR